MQGLAVQTGSWCKAQRCVTDTATGVRCHVGSARRNGTLHKRSLELDVLPRKYGCGRSTTCKATSSDGHEGVLSQRASFTSKIGDIISDHHLPLALLTGLILGSLQPEWGARASRTHLQSIVTIAIFTIAGLQLKRGEALKALQSFGSFAYGLVSILLLTPLAAVLVLRMPLEPFALPLGIAVFACMPTSLSSGITMTQMVGGNTAMAILLTIASNLLGVFTLPLVLPAVLGSGASGVYLDPVALLKQLITLVLLPTIVGATARACVPGLARIVDTNKKAISYFNATCLSAVPWMQVSKAASQQVLLNASGIAVAAFCGLILHVGFLAFNIGMVKLLRLGGKDPKEALRIQQAVVLQTSQKTLPVAVTVLGKLSAVLGAQAALAAVTAVFAHLSQIMIDSLLVSWWVRRQQQNGLAAKFA